MTATFAKNIQAPNPFQLGEKMRQTILWLPLLVKNNIFGKNVQKNADQRNI